MTTMSRRRRVIALLLVASGACIPAGWGANAILHPHRRAVTMRPDLPFEDVRFERDGVAFKGWAFRAQPKARTWLVYLHGIADNRQSGLGFAHRFVPQGFDVLLYDGRGHGESGGDAVTYGALEKEDLRRALDAVGAERAIVFGCSLGASVALQAAPLDPRIVGVIAQSPFADLRSIVFDRKPAFLTRAKVEAALALAAKQGRFEIDDASVLQAAPAIRVPVLLIHGGADRDTSPAHSRRIFDALPGSKELLIVAGAGHNDTLAGQETWRKIDAWLAPLR
jgi:uncharacterized protein